MTVQQQDNQQQNNQQQTAPQAPDLQTISQGDNMQTGNASEGSAAGSSAEDTLSKLFEQSQAQVAQLIKQNESLQSQIGLLLRNGAVTANSGEGENAQDLQQVGNMTQAQLDYKQSEDYVSLSDLGKEIGKREYRNINTE